MSKYKEFQEYVDKVVDIMNNTTNLSSSSWLEAELEVLNNMDDVLESYITRDKPKDCAKKILGEVNE